MYFAVFWSCHTSCFDLSDPARVFMDGFVFAYNKTGQSGAAIMDCFAPEHVPVITTLASEFALFDSYFAGVPGPTFPNRLFSMSATSDGFGDNSASETALGWPQVRSHVAAGRPHVLQRQSLQHHCRTLFSSGWMR